MPRICVCVCFSFCCCCCPFHFLIQLSVGANVEFFDLVTQLARVHATKLYKLAKQYVNCVLLKRSLSFHLSLLWFFLFILSSRTETEQRKMNFHSAAVHIGIPRRFLSFLLNYKLCWVHLHWVDTSFQCIQTHTQETPTNENIATNAMKWTTTMKINEATEEWKIYICGNRYLSWDETANNSIRFCI